MFRKFFALSFDDGLEQDRRIISLLKKYTLGGTFHLNSGLFGEKGYVGIDKEGVTKGFDVAELDSRAGDFPVYSKAFRLSENEDVQLYKEFEVASHTVTHADISAASDSELKNEIVKDVKALSELFGQEIRGFAYPYGRGADRSSNVLKEIGICYARTVAPTENFCFPADPMYLGLNAQVRDADVFSKLESFFAAQPDNDDLLFVLFTHGYELDYETDDCSWEKFERICSLVSSREDITPCCIGDAFRMHRGKSPLYYPYK